jgi:hypothetical protein
MEARIRNKKVTGALRKLYMEMLNALKPPPQIVTEISSGRTGWAEHITRK